MPFIRFVRCAVLSAAIAWVLTYPALAQQANTSKSATDAYHAAMAKMDKDIMSMKMTGDADHDFVMMMIPHHQAAIEMARIQMQQGKDPEIKKMSEQIAKGQESEVKQLRTWLETHKR